MNESTLLSFDTKTKHTGNYRYYLYNDIAEGLNRQLLQQTQMKYYFKEYTEYYGESVVNEIIF